MNNNPDQNITKGRPFEGKPPDSKSKGGKRSMQHKVLWTWDCRMIWSVPGLQSVIIDEDAYIRNYACLIDYMAETGLSAVIIWGFLRSTHGGIKAAAKLADYAAKKGVRIIPGIGVKSYGGFAYETAKYRIDDEVRKWSLDQFLLDNPELTAVDGNNKIKYWSHFNADFYRDSHVEACPSKIDRLLDWYLEGIEWLYKNFDIGGIYLETGDSTKICQCGQCLERRGNAPDSGVHFLSYEDEALWMPAITGKALEMDADSWVMYCHNKMYTEEMCKNPPTVLLEKIPKKAITVWAVQNDGSNASKVLYDCNDSEGYRKRLSPPEPKTFNNISYWSYGGNWILWSYDGYPQYRQIANAIKAGFEMGHTGISFYGEVGLQVSPTGRYNFNDVNYLAMRDFCDNPDLTIEEFEDRYGDKLMPMWGWLRDR